MIKQVQFSVIGLLVKLFLIILFLQSCERKPRDPLGAFAATASGSVAYSNNGGSSWTLATTKPDGSAVNSIFYTSSNNRLYAGTQKGNIAISTNNGATWSLIPSQNSSPVTSIFVVANVLYAGLQNGNIQTFTVTSAGLISKAIFSQPSGSHVTAIFVKSLGSIYAGTANGVVEFSKNGGAPWTAINGKPDGSAVRGVYITNNKLYVNTANERVYTSTNLTGGGSWTPYAQTVYTLFISAGGNIYSATQGGYVFSLPLGTKLGFVTYSPVNSIYF